MPKNESLLQLERMIGEEKAWITVNIRAIDKLPPADPKAWAQHRAIDVREYRPDFVEVRTREGDYISGHVESVLRRVIEASLAAEWKLMNGIDPTRVFTVEE